METWRWDINDPASGIYNLYTDVIKLYPVYVEDILYIDSETQVSSVVVTSIMGAQVMQVHFPGKSINMNMLNKGIYVVRIKLSNNNFFIGKVIKQ